VRAVRRVIESDGGDPPVDQPKHVASESATLCSRVACIADRAGTIRNFQVAAMKKARYKIRVADLADSEYPETILDFQKRTHLSQTGLLDKAIYNGLIANRK
jgi:hypothetical protein